MKYLEDVFVLQYYPRKSNIKIMYLFIFIENITNLMRNGASNKW